MNSYVFKLNISDDLVLPDKFTYPFYYEVHPVTQLAVEHFQKELPNDLKFGKMFGVLIVKNGEEYGYIRATSGKLINPIESLKLIPAINNQEELNRKKDTAKKEVELLNQNIEEIISDKARQSLIDELQQHTNTFNNEYSDYKLYMKSQKAIRKQKRINADDKLLMALSKESITQKKELKLIEARHKDIISPINEKLNIFENKLNSLKQKRTSILQSLQEEWINSFYFLNYENQGRSLKDIFSSELYSPPAGSGDCCAPKLLQFAYENNLEPIAMAEFWWGPPHKSSIRQHKNFYPSCTSRCKPILGHMMKGLSVEDNPMLTNKAENLELSILFEDDYVIIVNKPSGLLSVDGKNIKDSVQSRTGHIIVHRLDQSTSGIMILAKDEKTAKKLQSQFINRTIKKRYIALLEGKVEPKEGKIKLPLKLDFNNRPRQMVCYKEGKHALTEYKVINIRDNRTLIHFYPSTGRTHQLRMHAAYFEGLNCPIVGDTLYGVKDTRLHLHADRLIFTHPKTNECITIESPELFSFN